MSYVRFPTKITAGVTFKQSFNLTAYPASSGWSLLVYLRGTTSINMQSTADGNQHLFNIYAETTKTYQAGHYGYSLRAVNISGEVEELDSGVLEIIADLSAINTSTDLRSHAQKTLAALEAVIEGRASLDQERYRINNRELYRTPLETLLKLRAFYRAEVAREQAKAKGKSLFGQVVRVTLE